MKNFLQIILLFIATSCASRIEKHGYMFDMSDHEMVRDGVTSKDRLSKLMGSPTLVINFDDEVWIYYAEDVKHFLFFHPQIVDRKILALRFDKNDVVMEMRVIDLGHEVKGLKFAEHHTQVDNHERGLFKSFFSNVGQYKPQ